MEYSFNTILTEELSEFNVLYEKTLKNHSSLFQHMIDYITEGGGKKIRPTLVFLSAKLCGTPNQKTADYAVIVELLHTATLIHDDVVDKTMERRNRLSVNAKYDNRLAVLLGDFVLTLAIQLGVKTENLKILSILAELSKNLVEGELFQLTSSGESIINENRYFEIIYKKTATLLATCTEMGAISVDTDKEKLEKMRLIGEKLGLCFQIKDDIFDYFDQGEIGKPTGNDIREGKITLPLIYSLNNAPEAIASEMKQIIKYQNFNSENITKLIDFAKTYKGIDYAQQKMEEIKEDILSLLSSFDESEAKKSMIQFVDFIIKRKK